MKAMKKRLSRATSLLLTVVMLLGMMTTGVFAAETGASDASPVGTLVENAILYQVNSNDELEYNGVHKASIGSNVAVTDKTDNGISSLEALQSVMGVADAPEVVLSYLPGERTLGKAVTANLWVDGENLTAVEVTGVSESTVVRFAADLGYRGYPGMKKALQEIVRNRLTSVERIEAAESTMDGHDVLKAVLRADINNLQATLDEVDQDNFDQTVDMILSAKHIYIIGMRTSTTLADFLGIYLKLLLDNVTVVKEIAAREVYEQMLRIGEGDLIIGISYPRYSKRTISAMKFARDHGARCLGMTDSKASPLNEISDVCLYAKSEMVSFLDSLVAPMSLINALIMAVGARDRERTFETFRELETVWKEYEVYGTVES